MSATVKDVPRHRRASTFWLLRNDLKLGRRDFRVGTTSQKSIAFVIFLGVIVILHLAGFAAAPKLVKLHAAGGDSLTMVTVILIGVSALCLSKAMSGMLDQMRDHGDLELLITSPLPPRIMLRARLIAIALGAGAMPLIAAIPIINGMMLRGRFDWVGVYPVLVSLALIAAVLAVSLFLGLLAAFGPKQARLAARVIATALGGIAFLSSQTLLVFSPAQRNAAWQAVRPENSLHPAGLGWIAARAMYGEPLSIIVMLTVAIGGTLLITRFFERSYGESALAILNADRGGRAIKRAHFGAPLWYVLLRKELRNFIRQPGLAIQIIYQFIFLIPAASAVIRLSEGVPASGGVLFITVMMTGRISSVFMDVIIRNDRAADLVVSAPIDQNFVFRVKVAILIAAVFAVTAPLLLIVLFKMPYAVPVIAGATTGSVVTRFWLELRKPRTVHQTSLRGRLHFSPASLTGAMTDIAWSVAGGMVLALIYTHQH
jgi:ABC-2 type transport system permease protein